MGSRRGEDRRPPRRARPLRGYAHPFAPRLRRPGSAALYAVLLLVLASRASAEERPGAGGRCTIDAVFGVFASGGNLFATGFAFDSDDGAPVRKVQLTLDGNSAGDASLSGLRPDVRAHYARPDYLWSGWNGKVSLDGVKPGRHTVEIVAIDHDGKPISCGSRTFEVIAAPTAPRRSVFLLGAETLFRTALFLGWLTFVGRAAGALLKIRAGHPFLGLALFGVLAEAAGVLHVRPFQAALFLTVLAAGILIWRVAKGRLRLRLRLQSRGASIVLAISVLFAIVAVIPLASHGPGAVLGDIDDASRECIVADSYSRFGWSVPADVRGHIAAVRTDVEAAHVRPGGIYLLSALADAFRTRAYDVHSVAMLGTACLAIWGAAFLAHTLTRGRDRKRSAVRAAIFLAINSILLATLYGQHLGSLLGVALFLPFAAFCVKLVRLGGLGNGVTVALFVSAELVFYPEILPLWGIAALLSIATVRRGRNVRSAATRLALALLLVIAVNPVGLVRFFRFFGEFSRKLSTPEERMVTGDTHYFPSLAVIAGLEAYREDAPAPVGNVRRILVPVAGGIILIAGVLGWANLTRRERAGVALILVPVAAGLLANYRLSFPYGYAKLLPMGAGTWAVAFSILLTSWARSGRPVAVRARRVFVPLSIVAAVLLALPSLRHVLQRAVRSVPAYDPAYRVLPELVRPLGRDAIVLVDEPIVASREWIRYFLAENRVLDRGSTDTAKGPRFLLVDLRAKPQEAGAARIRARRFGLIPISGDAR